MSNIIIDTLHKFRKLPFESEFFNDTYTLVGRSGKSGVMDQLLQIFPNCVAGINVLDADEDIAYLELYLMFFRLHQGNGRKYDFIPAYLTFTATEDACISKAPFTFFSDKKYLELYSLTHAMPDLIQKDDSRFLDEQRILFNEQLGKTHTALVNVEDLFFGKDLKSSNYFDITTPIDDTGLIKEYQNLGPIRH